MSRITEQDFEDAQEDQVRSGEWLAWLSCGAGVLVVVLLVGLLAELMA